MNKFRVIETNQPLHARDLAKKEIKRYRNQTPWKLDVPNSILERDRIVRSATKTVEYQPTGRVSGKVAFWSALILILIAAYGLYEVFTINFR